MENACMTSQLKHVTGCFLCLLTGEEQPQLSPHALRNALENKLLRLLCPVHTHALSILRKVVFPRLLLQELLRLGKGGNNR